MSFPQILEYSSYIKEKIFSLGPDKLVIKSWLVVQRGIVIQI